MRTFLMLCTVGCSYITLKYLQKGYLTSFISKVVDLPDIYSSVSLTILISVSEYLGFDIDVETKLLWITEMWLLWIIDNESTNRRYD